MKRFLTEVNIAFEDVGAALHAEGDDYADFARAAAEKITISPLEHKGILLCGSGHGVDMVANKFKGIRAALCWNAQVARQSREHEDANVLVLPADWIDEQAAKNIVAIWLSTPFRNEERHVRRLKKIQETEHRNFK